MPSDILQLHTQGYFKTILEMTRKIDPEAYDDVVKPKFKNYDEELDWYREQGYEIDSIDEYQEYKSEEINSLNN